MNSRFRFYPLISLALAVCSALVALPGRAIAFAYALVDRMFATDPRPMLAGFGTDAAIAPSGSWRSIDPALANDQRHEAGLARLGAVRHR